MPPGLLITTSGSIKGPPAATRLVLQAGTVHLANRVERQLSAYWESTIFSAPRKVWGETKLVGAVLSGSLPGLHV